MVILLDFDLFNLITAGIELGDTAEIPTGMQNNIVNFSQAGLGVGVYYNVFSRMYLGAGAGLGFYKLTFDSVDEAGEASVASTSDMYYRAYGEVGFRINPTVTISGTGGYISYNISKSKFTNSPIISHKAKITLESVNLIFAHWCFLPLFATIYAKGGESHEENHHPAAGAFDERVFGGEACRNLVKYTNRVGSK